MHDILRGKVRFIGKRGHVMQKIDSVSNIFTLLCCCLAISACAPTVKVEAPSEPITINLNIKLDADVRVKLEEEAKQDVASNPDLF